MKDVEVNMDSWVERAALELAHRHSLDEIESLLVEAGATPDSALKLALLIPSAFAREYFASEGIEFPDTFLVGPPGSYSERPYSSEPIHVSARALARRWLSESRPSLIARVIDWSAEANSIKQAREQGLTPTRLSTVHHGF
jgi:hypothetical protein